MELLPGMKAVVVGLGKSGLAAVRYLHSQGVQVKVSEHRLQEALTANELEVLEQCGAVLESGGHSEDFFVGSDLIVVSPGVPGDLVVLQKMRSLRVPVLGELALAAGRIPVPVIGVTGSNGKTTVTALIGHLLRAAGKKVFVGGNIGTPILDYLLDPGDAEVVVLELSSFQLETAGEFRPDIALLLNLSPDHLDRHGSMEGYAAAKRKIFAHQGAGDTAIIGSDDPLVTAEPLPTAARVYTFGRGSGCRAVVLDASVRLQPGFDNTEADEVYELSATALTSQVNRYNAAAAVLAARCCGCSAEDVTTGLGDFQPPEHRMTPVAEIGEVFFVNDSKATNVGAVAAALAGFAGKVVLIAGGRDKGSDFSVLRQPVREHVRHLVLIGEAADDLETALAGTTTVERARGMKEAVSQAFAAAQPLDTVLLAPACASFDMFANYGERGRVFTACVLELQREVEAG